MQIVSVVISFIALVIALITAWLTLFRRGTLRMTKPTLVFFGPDGPAGIPKVFLRTLLYSTSKRGQIIENMFVKLRHRDSCRNFNIWVYGEGPLVRGSGLFVPENGVSYNHHFLLLPDSTSYRFESGNYTVETYASLLGKPAPLLINVINLSIEKDQAELMKGDSVGLFFDLDPDSTFYHSHLDKGNSFHNWMEAMRMMQEKSKREL